MKKYKVGDRVKLLGVHYSEITEPIGKIVHIINEDYMEEEVISVEFENSFDGGHDCDGHAKVGYGYNFHKRSLKLIGPEVKLSKKDRNSKVNKIIKEIKADKEYLKCFASIKEMMVEVNSWDDPKIEKW